MRLKNTFVLADLNGKTIAVPLREKNGFQGILRLNSTGATVIRGLQENLTEKQIAEKIVEEYEGVDFTHARASVSRALNLLRDHDLLEVEE